jgi:hypothetical protein
MASRIQAVRTVLGLTKGAAHTLLMLYDTPGPVRRKDLDGLCTRRSDEPVERSLFRGYVHVIRAALGDPRVIDTIPVAPWGYEMTSFGRASLDELMEWS